MRRAWQVAKRSVVSFYYDQATHHAAALTYYAPMSLFDCAAPRAHGIGGLRVLALSLATASERRFEEPRANLM